MSTLLNTSFISAFDNLPSSRKARDKPSTTTATPAIPAIKTALSIGTPAIVPAPITPRPDAAKVARILRSTLIKSSFFILIPSYAKAL
ncbi:MAG: hypothetical protein O3A39_03950 [Proteobacteria bacterium]|nr:hypothetical protein [Pseudomonadota bacterium]